MTLTSQQIEFFDQHGYLVVDDLISQERVAAVKAEYEMRMAGMVDAWVEEGKLGAEVRGSSFLDAIKASYGAGLDYLQPLNISLPQSGITPETPMHTGTETFELIVDPNVLDVVESIIGPEITANPIQHVRLKPPSRILEATEASPNIGSTPWHQDRGIVTEDADLTHMITVWVAITDATVDNGCLRVVEDTQHCPMLPHCLEQNMGIPPRFINKTVVKPLEIKSGGAILFHPMTIHSAGDNNTESLRWSFDLRYNRTGEPTGREHFPDFIARSRTNSVAELRDSAQWSKLWEDTRARLTQADGLVFHRWKRGAQVCA